jgi:hypothetical protein
MAIDERAPAAQLFGQSRFIVCGGEEQQGTVDATWPGAGHRDVVPDHALKCP